MNSKTIDKFKIIIDDKGYNSEENHIIAKKHCLFVIIPARNEDVPIHRTKRRIGRR